MPRPRERRTYRLRQLPQHLELQDVAEFLCKVSSDFGTKEDIRVFSLASSLITWEKPPTKTATLVFLSTPRAFDNDGKEWSVSARNAGWNRNLIFDVHFEGFTALNDVEDPAYLADCIALSGFASHPFGSWKQRGPDTDFMWIRDKLPEDLPAFRQILFGYDASLTSNDSFQVVEDIALSLIAKLRSIGRSSKTAKPIIFFAHSLGGIVLKQAMVVLAGSSGVEKVILQKIRGVFFFGVPHLGMEMAHLLEIVQGQPNEPLVRTLSRDGSYLTLLDDQFRGIALFPKVRIISAYETKMSQSTQMSTEGIICRTGDLHVAVDRHSAVHGGSESRFPINRDHSNLVKFSENDSDYHTVASYLNEVADALSAVEISPSRKVDVNKMSQDISSPASLQIPRKEFFTADALLGVADHDVPERVLTELEGAERTLKVMFERSQESQDIKNELFELIESLEGQEIRGDPGGGRELQDARRRLQAILDNERETVDLARRIESLWNKSVLRSDLIRSLDVPALRERFDKIEDASNGTFDWIFGDPDVNLAHWLRSGTGIYWIRGKPGSGKSTLMKYLHNHPKTSELLKTWKPGRLQIDAWFFFDVRGSHIQRSLEGVLHSILHRLVSSHNGFADKILPIYTARVPARRDEWPLSDLQQALLLLLDQEDVHVDLHLFLDALDEYGDPPEIIADFVADLAGRPASSWTKTKVFFSSRLWTIFLDRFGQVPGFFIHEHTKGDIRRFVRRTISEHGLPAGSAADEDRHNVGKLCSDICERAEGVFLWVKLVSSELVKAHHGGASIAELRQLVSNFSLELDHYYAEIVNQIPESRRFESFVMLEIVVRSQRQLSIEEFIGTLQCAPCQTMDECLAVLAERNLEPTSPEKTTRLIRDYAGGLLELVRFRGSWIVQLMHQTVKDFISTPGFMRRLLGPELNEIWENGHSFLAKFRIAWAVSNNSGWAISASENALLAIFHAGMSESTTGIRQRKFLNSLTDDAVELGFRKFLEINSRMSFAVIADLRLYVRQALTEVNVVNNNPSVSLLYCLASCTAALCDPEGAFAAL